MIVKKCKNCGGEFKTTLSRIKDNRGKFCSKTCHYKFRKENGLFKKDNHPRWNRTEISCNQCSKRFSIIKARRDIAKYCSSKCYWEWKKGRRISIKSEFKKGHKRTGKGESHPYWKGGKLYREGYILLYRPTHPNADKRGYMRQARLVAGKCLGRYLIGKEIIHHINGIKDDDKSKNLYLFPSSSEHMKYHQLKVKSQLASNLL